MGLQMGPEVIQAILLLELAVIEHAVEKFERGVDPDLLPTEGTLGPCRIKVCGLGKGARGEVLCHAHLARGELRRQGCAACSHQGRGLPWSRLGAHGLEDPPWHRQGTGVPWVEAGTELQLVLLVHLQA